ncbi:cytochrome C biogenesis protein transmembrane region [Olsenella profusa F0195]|uniref:Cytochrome C biogenesis protein transmembrane region n=1 Tax=Olsenella profusa F0195 TaxID=1125712 RepID=U2VEB9_9ACTN|nr:cytochrome C biogenesis protein transmembrane region [Olsenella profusa F0195]
MHGTGSCQEVCVDIGLLLSAAGAGLLSFFSPCILPLLPVYVGILTTDAGNELMLGRRVANTVAFVLGISFVFVALGVGAGALGSFVINPYVNVALGLVIFVFGLHLAGVLDIPLLLNERRADLRRIKVRGVVSAFVLGLAFSFGWTPCVGPILGTILAMAAGQGSALVGGVLLLVYALGLCLPFVVITLASGMLLGRLKRLSTYLPVVKAIGGVLIAIMGLWMVFSEVDSLVNSNRALQSAIDDAALVAPAGKAPQGEDDPDSDASDASVLNGALGVRSGEESGANVSSAWKNVVLTDLDGTKHRMSEYKGKPLYFEFWGSWCTSCVEDLDQMTRIYEEHEAAGDVRFMSVVVPNQNGELSPEGFVSWAHDNDVQIPVLMDTNGSLMQFIGVRGFPTSVFVGSDGEIRKIHVGAMSIEEFEQSLSELS